MAPFRLSFLIHSTYDQLSSKNNLFKWKKEGDSTSLLCNDKAQTLDHILSSHKTAFRNGSYNWRHNRVLEDLVKSIKNYMKSELNISTQKFVSERGRIYASSKQASSIRTFSDQMEIGRYLLTYQDGKTIIQKQYLAKVCD